MDGFWLSLLDLVVSFLDLVLSSQDLFVSFQDLVGLLALDLSLGILSCPLRILLAQ